MSKWVVDIHGDIEGDYEIIKEYKEPKTGHWVPCVSDLVCSLCNKHTDKRYPYCPNCGARMESEEKEPIYYPQVDGITPTVVAESEDKE